MGYRAAVVMSSFLVGTVGADVTYLSRNTTVWAEAQDQFHRVTASTTGFELFDETVTSAYQGPWSSSFVTVRQRSELLPRGVSFFATATGMTQYNSRGSSSARYSNLFDVEFELAHDLPYHIALSGGDSIPPTAGACTLTGPGGAVIVSYRGFDLELHQSGVLTAGRYQMHVLWESHGAAGTPLYGTDFSIALDVECPADFNNDGFVDFFDYDDFVGCFETGICPPGADADFNRDGFADFFDYDAFVGAFEMGC